MLDKKTNKKLSQVVLPNSVKGNAFRRQPIVPNSNIAQNQPVPLYYIWTACEYDNPFVPINEIQTPDYAGIPYMQTGWGPPINEDGGFNIGLGGGTMWAPGVEYVLCASEYIGSPQGDPNVVGWAAASQTLWESLGEPESGESVGWLATTTNLSYMTSLYQDANNGASPTGGVGMPGAVPLASCIKFVGKSEYPSAEGLDLNPPSTAVDIDPETYIDAGFGPYAEYSEANGNPIYPGTCFAPNVNTCENCSTSANGFVEGFNGSVFNSNYFYWFGCMHPEALNYNPEAICPLPLYYCNLPSENGNEGEEETEMNYYFHWKVCGTSNITGIEWAGSAGYMVGATTYNELQFYQLMGSPNVGEVVQYILGGNNNMSTCLEFIGQDFNPNVPTTLPLSPSVTLVNTFADCTTCQTPAPPCDCPLTITYNDGTPNAQTVSTNYTGAYDANIQYNAGDTFTLDWNSDGLSILTSHPDSTFVALITSQGLSNPITQFEFPSWDSGVWVLDGNIVSTHPPCMTETGPSCYIYLGATYSQTMANAFNTATPANNTWFVYDLLPLSQGPSVTNGGSPYWAGAYSPVFGWTLNSNTLVWQQQGLLPLNRNFVCCSSLIPDCTDPMALNYNPNALVGCDDTNGDGLPDCCIYYQPPTIVDEKKCLPALTKEEFLMNVCQKPETRSDVFIERGKVSVFERCQRLSVNPTIGELELHGYGYYKFENQS